MRLKDYICLNDINKIEFAENLEIHKSYLSKLCSGIMRPSRKLCRHIERATNGNVTIRDLRPDLFEDQEAVVIEEKIG